MAKKTVNKIESMGPSELDEFKKQVQEYISRHEELEGHMAGIKEDLKTLDDEFSEKVDLKTLKQVVKILKIESEIAHKDTADTIREALTDPST